MEKSANEQRKSDDKFGQTIDNISESKLFDSKEGTIMQNFADNLNDIDQSIYPFHVKDQNLIEW